MSDLRIDYGLLTDSSASLGLIARELAGMEQRSAQASDLWGSATIGTRMGEVAGNWDRHRRELGDAVTATRDMVDAALSAFRETDAELAKTFDKQSR